MRLTVLMVVELVVLVAASSAHAYPWENGEPAILLGAGIEQVCEYCQPVTGTVTGPADGLAIQAANTPLAKAYGAWLNSPCTWPHTQPNEADPCTVAPLYTGPVAFGYSPSWFWGEPTTYRVWALREAGTCVVHYTPPYQTCAGPNQVERQEVCSPPQPVTLPATITVVCRSVATASIERDRARRRGHRDSTPRRRAGMRR